MFGKKPEPMKPDELVAAFQKALELAHEKRHADPKNDCPKWQAPCREHKCRWYIQVLGKNPNTGENENKFACAISWLPILQIETSQQARQAGASADKVATEVRKFHNKMVDMNSQTAHQIKALQASEGDQNGRGIRELPDLGGRVSRGTT